MAQLVAAFASSHSPMLTSDVDDWANGFPPLDMKRPHFDAAGRPTDYAGLLQAAPADAMDRIAPAALAARHAATRRNLARLRADIAAARLDALIIVGDDQEELFDATNMPAIGIWYGDTIPNGPRPVLAEPSWQQRAWAHYQEEGAAVDYPCDAALARHILADLGEVGFDLAACARMADGQHEGHAFSFVHKVLGAAMPVVPVFLNTFYPPNQPTPKRCLALGQALRRAVERHTGSKRVGIFASGGLSHFWVDTALDEEVIAALRARDYAALGALAPARLQSGNSEIRNWICLAGALGGATGDDLALDWIDYVPGWRSPALTGTGLCFAHWGA